MKHGFGFLAYRTNIKERKPTLYIYSLGKKVVASPYIHATDQNFKSFWLLFLISFKYKKPTTKGNIKSVDYWKKKVRREGDIFSSKGRRAKIQFSIDGNRKAGDGVYTGCLAGDLNPFAGTFIKFSESIMRQEVKSYE